MHVRSSVSIEPFLGHFFFGGTGNKEEIKKHTFLFSIYSIPGSKGKKFSQRNQVPMIFYNKIFSGKFIEERTQASKRNHANL